MGKYRILTHQFGGGFKEKRSLLMSYVPDNSFTTSAAIHTHLTHCIYVKVLKCCYSVLQSPSGCPCCVAAIDQKKQTRASLARVSIFPQLLSVTSVCHISAASLSRHTVRPHFIKRSLSLGSFDIIQSRM